MTGLRKITVGIVDVLAEVRIRHKSEASPFGQTSIVLLLLFVRELVTISGDAYWKLDSVDKL